MSLNRGEPISQHRAWLFSLACALECLQPTNGKKVKGGDVDFGTLEIYKDHVKSEERKHRQVEALEKKQQATRQVKKPARRAPKKPQDALF